MRNFNLRFAVALLSASLLVLFTVPCFAQQATGTVLGTVTDPAGAVVPGANITVRNVATGSVKPATTDKDGTFHVIDLPIGTYVVTAEHQGFAKIETSPQALQINQNLRFDIKMKVGTQQEVLEVTGTAAGVETVNSTLGQSVTSRPIIDLPLNGRDVLQLALLQPGVTETNPENSGAGSYSIAGGRTDSVTFLLDGGVNNNLLDNSVVFDPDPDTIAEFRILQNNYTAEYGRNGGGVISVVTKSGTNAFHGSAFEFIRNDAFNANTYFNKDTLLNPTPLPRDVLKRNQFGGTFGGPIVKDKLFFFVSYEGQRLSALVNPTAYGDTSTTPVFTAAELKGNFANDPRDSVDPNSASGLTYMQEFLQANPYFIAPGYTYLDRMVDPSKFDAVAQKYISAGLLPTTSNSSGLVTPTSNRTDDFNELSIKVDYNFTARDKFTFTLGGHKDQTTDPYEFASVNGFPNTNGVNSYFFNAAYTRTISNTMLNEFRFTAQRNLVNQEFVSGTNGAQNASTLGIGTTPDQPTGPPNIWFDNGFYLGYSEQGPTTLANNTFSYADTFSWVKGKHNFKFGAAFTPYQNNTVYDYYVNGEFDFYPGGNSGTAGTGNDFADFLLGLPAAYYQYPSAPSNIRSKNSSFFAQDEWHVTRRLVLNFGTRYEYSTPKLDTAGRSFSLIPGLQSQRFTNSPLGLVYPGDPGAPEGANFPDKNDWAPRFGFAFDPFGDGKTSIRGGIGVFYDILKGEDNLQFNGQPPFFSSVGLYFYPNESGQSSSYGIFENPFGFNSAVNPFPSHTPSSNLNFGQAGFLPINSAGSVYIVDPHLRTPYTYQYNLSIEHELAKNTTMDLSYVGSVSHKLTSLVDINPFDLSTLNTNPARILNENSAIAAPGGCNDQANTYYGVPYCFANMPEFRNVGNQMYNALEASLTRQPTATGRLGLTYFTLAYTYAHNIDNSSGFRQNTSQVPYYDSNYFRADSDLDVRHRVTFSGGWDLALDHWWERGWKKVTQGWSAFPIFTWHTGFPLSVFARFSDRYDFTAPGPSGAGDPILSYANVVGPTSTYDPRAVSTFSGWGSGSFWLDPNSFSNACEYAGSGCPNGYGSPYGNLGRNSLRGPSYTNLDFELSKTTRFSERLNMQIRAEAFNILNHAEFKNPDLNLNSATFGQLTSTYDPRIIQLAVRFQF